MEEYDSTPMDIDREWFETIGAINGLRNSHGGREDVHPNTKETDDDKANRHGTRENDTD